MEYSYIFDLVGKWMYFPIGEAENGLRALKDDLESDTIHFAEPPLGLDDLTDLLGDEEDLQENEDDQNEKIELGGVR